MTAKTEAAFHQAMLDVYHQALGECGYRATRFLQMVNEQGGLNAAKRLLHSDKYPEGLTALWEAKRMDVPWRRLFFKSHGAIYLLMKNCLLPASVLVILVIR